MSILTALTRNVAATRPDASDPRLRGRAYPLPPAQVWEAALATARATRGWTVISADAAAGTIHAEARTRLWKFTDDVAVRIAPDGGGLTRVDLRSSSRVGRADLGTNARRVARFLHAGDARLRPAGEGGAPANR